jgi:hypothetical protein
MFHKWSELAAELAGVAGAQVYFVVHPVQAEPHGLVCRAASQIILQMHFDPLHYFPRAAKLRLAACSNVS